MTNLQYLKHIMAMYWPGSFGTREVGHPWGVSEPALQAQKLHVVCVHEPCSGVSLPFQQQLFPALPGAPSIGQDLSFHRIHPAGNLIHRPPCEQPVLPDAVQALRVYQVVRWLFLLKLALSGAMMLAGADQIYLLCVFIASNRVFTEGTCKLLNLVVTDLVDEDFVLNRRQQAASALLFGMVALVTKPGQTFAPLIGTWLLCVYTGYDIFERGAAKEAASAAEAVAGPARAVTLQQGCFYLLVFVPITCALLQLLAWSRFTLHGKRLQNVKALRQGAQHCRATDVKAV
ncbi:hypothetical protein ANANG_G00047230 [Anguilla anguilla]|uniref:Uncharacterized protein n=1 Tax=Anguilla anguilla TaxID=7936 RepID=A0A9D3MWS2_ANGAN|nr:hypothetical protein ANANG_G00047230 [Anguilla anguilla]